MNHLRQRSVWRYALALGCLVSVLLFSVASATHTHSGAATSSLTQDCRFCAINGANGAFAVSQTVTVITRYILFVLPLPVDLPFTSPSLSVFSSRAPPLLPS